MRVAPIGLYMKNIKMASQISAEASAITHGHPLGIIPAYVLGAMLYYILNEDIEIESALYKAINLYKNNFDIFESNINEEFINIVNKAVILSKENKSDIECIKEIGEGWVAEEAFTIALYSCLKYKNNFEEAIICSVNHDGDSDSTGSITGNIIGAFLGYEEIPKYYVDNLELNNVILKIAEDLSTPITNSDYSSNNNEDWLNKYLYCRKI